MIESLYKNNLDAEQILKEFHELSTKVLKPGNLNNFLKKIVCTMLSLLKAPLGDINLYNPFWAVLSSIPDNIWVILDLLSREAAFLIEQRRREKILAYTKEKSEKIHRTKNIFFATLSHELNTPLTAILTWVQMLKTDKLSPEKIKIGLQSIEDNALAQNRIIDDLLDISRIMTGKLNIEIQKNNLISILKNVVDSLRPAIVGKKLTIKEEYEDDQVFINADPIRIKQIFWNLLSNSIKFTYPNGEIILRVKKDNTKNRALISVIDTGQGINPKLLPVIFEQFKQAKYNNMKQKGGLGIGLTLVRSLTQLQKGTVEAFSKGIGQGAEFYVTFPLSNT